jgi:hypothetical protein
LRINPAKYGSHAAVTHISSRDRPSEQGDRTDTPKERQQMMRSSLQTIHWIVCLPYGQSVLTIKDLIKLAQEKPKGPTGSNQVH